MPFVYFTFVFRHQAIKHRLNVSQSFELAMFSDAQLAVIETAKALLLSAGLQPAANLTDQPTSQPSSSASLSEQGPPPVLHFCYKPSIAWPFTKDELARNLHIINHQLHAGAFIDHSLDAIIEYPE